MPGLAILLLLLLAACSTEQQEFFQRVQEERAQGAVWNYIGPTDTDPTAKALPIQCVDAETGVVCGTPFVLWKLKFPTK